MITTTSKYDVAEHLRTDEEMDAYLKACIEESGGDATLIAKAKEDIARARRMRDTGTSHVTPAGGNIFLDLGFVPEEAERLMAEAEKLISENLKRKRS